MALQTNQLDIKRLFPLLALIVVFYNVSSPVFGNYCSGPPYCDGRTICPGSVSGSNINPYNGKLEEWCLFGNPKCDALCSMNVPYCNTCAQCAYDSRTLKPSCSTGAPTCTSSGWVCPTPTPIPIIPCSDPDGLDANTKGTCTPKTGGVCIDTGKPGPCVDYCSSASGVREYACMPSGGCDSGVIMCASGKICVDGACVPGGCSDSDGTSTATRGTCTSGGYTYTDFCKSNRVVGEYVCSATNNCESTPIPCSGRTPWCDWTKGICVDTEPAPGPSGTPTAPPGPGTPTAPPGPGTPTPTGTPTTTPPSSYTCGSCVNNGGGWCKDVNRCSLEGLSSCSSGWITRVADCTVGPTPTGTPSGGGCSWWSSTFGICSSGCPGSNPLTTYVCCESAGAPACPGDPRPGCISYNPSIGETPCCSSSGYRTCTKTQECNPANGQCREICTDPSYSKYTDPYCSKCDHCHDGLLNCGEPTVDKCGSSCTVPQVQTFTVSGYGCAGAGPGRCASAGGTFTRLLSCSYYCYGCVYECQKTVDVFNRDSCYDGVQNCGEPCLDGGPNCVVGTETGYVPSYEVDSPLSNTIFYVDSSILCSDRADNDHDCATDCADSDCASLPVCQDTTPPVVKMEAPPTGAFIWSTVTVKVSAYDDKPMTPGYIAVRKDGALLHQFTAGECTGSGTQFNPYRCAWSWSLAPAEMGVRTLQGEARDWKSNLGTSSPVSVTVGCVSTADCTAIYGVKNYCPAATHVCTKCLRDQDFYCPDLECLGVDLDCCSTTVSCPSGLYCDIGMKTCFAKRGNFCSKQEDCSTSDYCSADAHVCVSRNFLFIKPHFVKMKVGTTETLDVTLTDPVNRTASYDLTVSGTGKNYAKFFGTQNKIRVTLGPGEAKAIPLSFSAGALGQYRIELEAVDTLYYRDSTNPPGGIRSLPGPNTQASLTVEAETRTPFLVSSPGPTMSELVVLAVLASLFTCYFGGREEKIDKS